MKVKSLSHVQLFEILWTVGHQAPVSMGFPMQEYWSGLPFPSPGDLPDPGIKPRSPGSSTGRRFNLWATREACHPKLNTRFGSYKNQSMNSSCKSRANIYRVYSSLNFKLTSTLKSVRGSKWILILLIGCIFFSKFNMNTLQSNQKYSFHCVQIKTINDTHFDLDCFK